MKQSFRELLDKAEQRLAAAGVEAPRLNAEELLTLVLGLRRRVDLFLTTREDFTEAELERFEQVLKRRERGEPLQHLFGEVEFYAHRFRCDSRALVPRPETEVLVELCLKELQDLSPAKQDEMLIVDVGTGTGIVAFSLAAAMPNFQVLGLDISQEALSLAKENLVQLETQAGQGELNLSKRVCLQKSDLLSALPVEEPVSLVVANLPYIASAELPCLSREVSFDPPLALDGGEDGLDLVRRLCAELQQRKLAGQCIERVALEVGYNQGQEAAGLLQQAGFSQVRVESDLQGVERFVLAFS